ncbi:alcohol dehydrogenase catalytic domain-containing protein [Burkholderia sp. ABCPW 111]|uniref:alcohol dehydrogenase catalytic domain-containing protein n=1 Tax=Burkholderia sp. ABCPW 111 TaxID=1820025 RepID=UPI002E12B930
MKAEGHRRRRSPPGPLDVRIEQTVIGANFVDTDFRSGPYPVASLPAVLGFEGAGVVEAAGGEVTRLRPGSLAHANDPELYARGASDLLDALVDGMVAPIGARYALTDAARARGAQGGEDNGKRDVDRVTRTMTTRDARARRASCVVRRASCVVRRASCVARRASCVVRAREYPFHARCPLVRRCRRRVQQRIRMPVERRQQQRAAAYASNGGQAPASAIGKPGPLPSPLQTL